MKNTRGYFETLAAMLSNGYRVDSALMGRDREEAFYNRFARCLYLSLFFLSLLFLPTLCGKGRL